MCHLFCEYIKLIYFTMLQLNPQLQRILKNIVDKQRSDPYSSFDPRAAMFVCNRWDQVPDVEREVVFQDTVRKLKRSWPNMDASQVSKWHKN